MYDLKLSISDDNKTLKKLVAHLLGSMDSICKETDWNSAAGVTHEIECIKCIIKISETIQEHINANC